jgi:hypothetical protein
VIPESRLFAVVVEGMLGGVRFSRRIGVGIAADRAVAANARIRYFIVTEAEVTRVENVVSMSDLERRIKDQGDQVRLCTNTEVGNDRCTLSHFPAASESSEIYGSDERLPHSPSV